MITHLKEAPAASILERYARLRKIEESFRINQHTLSMQPIYHGKPEDIKAHIALCYIAVSVLIHPEYALMLTQKMSIDTVLDELMHVHASKMYKAFHLQHNNQAQVKYTQNNAVTRKSDSLILFNICAGTH